MTSVLKMNSQHKSTADCCLEASMEKGACLAITQKKHAIDERN